jgi:sterol 3beta-glucosyltransferase
LDRARSLIKKHAKQDGDQTDEFEEDWTLIEEGEEVDVSAFPFGVQPPVTGIRQDPPKVGGASTVLGSMVMKKRTPESPYQD